MEYVPSAPERSKVPIAPMGFSHVSCFVLPGWRCICREWHSELLIVHHHGQHSLRLCACSRSKIPIAPMGKLLTRLPRLTLAQLRTLRSTTECTCRRDLLQTSHRPDGKCLVDMSISILIFDDGCCLDLPVWSTCHLRLKNQKFPSPRWETADALASSLTCTTVADASMNYSEYVPQRPRKFPWPRWENC